MFDLGAFISGPEPEPGTVLKGSDVLTGVITCASGTEPAPLAGGESSPVLSGCALSTALFWISAAESRRHLSLRTSNLVFVVEGGFIAISK